MERFTIGQMAQVNHVTKKTLMLYHKEGLLVPEEIDPITGYRYYSLSQCSTLDIIQQMKQTGLSLQEIRTVLEKRDVNCLRLLLERQTRVLSEAVRKLMLAQDTAKGLIHTCTLCADKPACNKITLEHVPRRRILRFSFPSYHLTMYREDDPQLSRWEKSLRAIKESILEQGLPLALFHNVGGIASLKSLKAHTPEIIGGYVFNPQGLGSKEEYWPDSFCLTVTIDTVFSEEGIHMECAYLQRFLDIADEEGYELCGEYYCESLAETPAFLFEGRDMMIRLRVPVRTAHPESSPYYREA